MHLSPNKRFYSYPSNKYNLEMYAGGSLLGIMSQYVFTDKGIDDLNIWMAELGTEEITQDRKVELEARFK